jgi:hypothetical protein
MEVADLVRRRQIRSLSINKRNNGGGSHDGRADLVGMAASPFPPLSLSLFGSAASWSCGGSRR